MLEGVGYGTCSGGSRHFSLGYNHVVDSLGEGKFNMFINISCYFLVGGTPKSIAKLDGAMAGISSPGSPTGHMNVRVLEEIREGAGEEIGMGV